ncbi:DUF3558 family protein [Streptomyces turgidiscabies]|uniref:Uncharacterized protein n=1 Tax=Streptomyces turgidiscabies (strain Car8) TaxID=698760 RepID=L7EV94_STRT8|nr:MULTISPECIES: DUF3558 family protein [Streptomyces]ELP62315.1 hypothetical protein STRTUCAR8_04788 [Streptomyces turgidiscabies Car8]MDX3498770.1 DUF3558 family protein [Streptomyces turgidiscabies]
MSEGTMHRPAQRDQRSRTAVVTTKRRQHALAALAAVPVLLLAAVGCSSDSGSDSGSGSGSADNAAKTTEPGAGETVSASPTVQAAAYQKLPEPCSVLTTKTLKELVPKGVKSGKEGSSNDTTTRGSCSWTSLVNNGVKGSQFRWLNVSLLRFESSASRGSGNELAQKYYESQVQDAQSAAGAKNVGSAPVAGAGDDATSVRYDLKKKEGAFRQQTVVVRVENVVVTLDYNGAGLAGEKTPTADSLAKAAVKAAKEAVAKVSSENGEGVATAPDPANSPSASASSSAKPSASPSGSATKSATKAPAAAASPSASKKN